MRRWAVTEAACCDDGQGAPSPTGDEELEWLDPVFRLRAARLGLQEAVQHGLAGVHVAFDSPVHQLRTGIRQPAAEQSTPQVRCAGHTTAAVNRVNSAYDSRGTCLIVGYCWTGLTFLLSLEKGRVVRGGGGGIPPEGIITTHTRQESCVWISVCRSICRSVCSVCRGVCMSHGGCVSVQSTQGGDI